MNFGRKIGDRLLKIYHQSRFPVQFLVKMAARSIKRRLFIFDQENQDPFNTPHHDFSGVRINRILSTLAEDSKRVNYLTAKCLNHEFNLLGSGWQKVDYFTPAKGFERWQYPVELPFTSLDDKFNWLTFLVPKAYLQYAQAYLLELKELNPQYVCIDWQRDFISGGRFDAQSRQEKQMSLYRPGMDIKVPWELGRLQHLPQLGLWAQINENNKAQLYNEFKCQVLDFMALNPVGYGANWACTMDVGIRTANLCLAMDLFSELFPDDTSWRSRMGKFIYIHAQHITKHLEYRYKISSNHYLANMAGLLYACAHLTPSEETNYWLALSAQEIAQALEWQFFNDGANFEQSTAYHRLSGEMIVWSFALVLGMNEQQRKIVVDFNQRGNPKEPKLKPHDYFSLSYPNFVRPDLLEKVIRLGLFDEKIHKPDEDIVQIGDNDSGRFFRLTPKGRFLNNQVAHNKYYNLQNAPKPLNDLEYWDENDLHHGAFLAAIEGLFGKRIFIDKLTQEFSVERQLIRSIVNSDVKVNVPLDRESFTDEQLFDGSSLQYEKTSTIKCRSINLDVLEVKLFRQFGLLIISNDHFFLSLRLAPKGQVHPSGSHQHMDTASIEMWCHGQNIIRDPGTYVYTASLDKRQKFRSSNEHYVPQIHASGPQIIGKGNYWAFNMIDRVKGALVQVSPTKINYQFRYVGVKVQRTIEINNDKVIITDKSNHQFLSSINKNSWFSPGYGKLIILDNLD